MAFDVASCYYLKSKNGAYLKTKLEKNSQAIVFNWYFCCSTFYLVI